jgi:hypothetical protein
LRGKRTKIRKLAKPANRLLRGELAMQQRAWRRSDGPLPSAPGARRARGEVS